MCLLLITLPAANGDLQVSCAWPSNVLQIENFPIEKKNPYFGFSLKKSDFCHPGSHSCLGAISGSWAADVPSGVAGALQFPKSPPLPSVSCGCFSLLASLWPLSLQTLLSANGKLQAELCLPRAESVSKTTPARQGVAAKSD